MTLEEAKKKWCPATRIAYWQAGISSMTTVNRFHNEIYPKCLADNCMWWTGEGCGMVERGILAHVSHEVKIPPGIEEIREGEK